MYMYNTYNQDDLQSESFTGSEINCSQYIKYIRIAIVYRYNIHYSVIYKFTRVLYTHDGRFVSYIFIRVCTHASS